jgi:hypothetical protein
MDDLGRVTPNRGVSDRGADGSVARFSESGGEFPHAGLARRTARNQYGLAKNTIVPSDLDEGALVEQRDQPIDRHGVVSRRSRDHRRRSRPALFTDDVHPVEAGEGLADRVITEQVGVELSALSTTSNPDR